MNTTINTQTPGPLTVEPADDAPSSELHAYGAGRFIANVESCPAPTVGPDEAPANARLLAAAYTLLDRTGRELGVDAAALAEGLDLVALIRAARKAAEIIADEYPASDSRRDTSGELFQLLIPASTPH